MFFTIGKTLIGLYLGKSSVGSAYGAAGSVIVVIVWVYYSAQIFFFGAEFTHVYGERLLPGRGSIGRDRTRHGGIILSRKPDPARHATCRYPRDSDVDGRVTITGNFLR